MKTKTIEYSYPTSPNAKSFGFNDTGCWTVEYNYFNKIPEPVKAFEDIRDAVEFALNLPEKWNHCFLRFGLEHIKDEKLLNAIRLQSQ